ncbi:Polypeptide-transport-associated domain protein ShlB-type [Burkholderia sp. lig30]|jgi:hemolysin activation/secretion protein|uniref:ShlB/FhaC/HecB family hemolysin secretion/activation protein n=1 Tax=Burkholderia sp. lig30 TaxID=1192124 RepID=UPI000461F51E|nr:ShlB/FhaC/HecB family hemolysin secretion/activation protein [Burkholderia sp. lig30]KDB08767.1 Polypeptide-transport-associated domain protein ShlB-type [Burkholderia sp. lig30]
MRHSIIRFPVARRACRFAGLWLTALAATPVLAQMPPDAGALRQQIEPELPPALPRPVAPDRTAPPPPMRPRAEATVTVSAFRFAGNKQFSDAQLAPVVAGFLNRPLSFSELQAAAAAVAEVYRAAGWVVRVYLPAQDVRAGIITIQVVEGMFGGVRIEGKGPQRVSRERIEAGFAAHQAVGAPLNTAALDRALLLANDLPGVSLVGRLQPGAQEQETDLALNFVETPLATGNIGVDNQGARSTGAARLVANASVNSLAGIGDQLLANGLLSQGYHYLRLGYTVPVGYDGWRVGVNASHLDYRLVTDDFEALNARGYSNTVGLEASYPLVRARQRNLYLVLNYDHKTYDNEASEITTSRYFDDTLSVGLSGNLFDGLGGGGANTASMMLTGGSLNLGQSPTQPADAMTLRTAGTFLKMRYAMSRQQVLTDALSAVATLSGQVASKNLDSSEKFYLGGPGGVRAYPIGEGGGSDGQLINLELRWRLRYGVSLSGFYDWGHVTVNHDNNFPGASPLNSYQLQGAGLGVQWQPGRGVNLGVTWAHRIGANPNATAFGKDQDGSHISNRVWLTGSLSF